MINSFTLIRVHPAYDKDVYLNIRNFEEVKEIILTYGEYDLIIKVESDSIEDLDNFIFNRLRRIKGVAATTSLIEAKPNL